MGSPQAERAVRAVGSAFKAACALSSSSRTHTVPVPGHWNQHFLLAQSTLPHILAHASRAPGDVLAATDRHTLPSASRPEAVVDAPGCGMDFRRTAQNSSVETAGLEFGLEFGPNDTPAPRIRDVLAFAPQVGTAASTQNHASTRNLAATPNCVRSFSSSAPPHWGGQRPQATPELAMELKTLGVVGAGQMGSGIAQLGATAGMEVVLVDVGEGALERGMHRIRSSLERLAKKDQMTQDECDAAAARIRCSGQLEDLGAADFVVEAVAESEGLKQEVFARLDDVTPPHAILASNTSSISITLIGAATERAGKVIGMHFMNPPPIMSLVEIVNGLATDPHTSQVTESLAARMGKTVCFARDYPGFIVNRLLMPMINEAFYALLEGVGTAEDIDTGMKLGTNQPMGPLTLADFIGLDTCVAIMRVLHTRLADAKYRPCPLLVQYVDAGWLGRKSGRGVYLYRVD